MSDWKSEAKALLGDAAADSAKGLWRLLRRCAVYAAVGAVLVGALTYWLIGDFWFGMQIGALLGFVASLGLRALRDGMLG